MPHNEFPFAAPNGSKVIMRGRECIGRAKTITWARRIASALNFSLQREQYSETPSEPMVDRIARKP
jgi:hypothetical protein